MGSVGGVGGIEMNIEPEPSICPGCCIGCGLYLLESEGVESDEKRRKVLHRKMSVVNEGKLCRFGTNLHEYYYGREALSNSVDGKGVEGEEAIKEAKERLKSMKSDEIAFIALPNTTTNEEIVSFVSLASEFGCKNLSFGFERFFKELPKEASYIIETGLPFSEVEKAKKIVLFFLDPFVQYPLIARRILKAKKNGAKIIEVSFAKNERGIADETILANPIDVDFFSKIKEEEEMFNNSLIIAELTPYTDSQLLSLILWINASTSSKLFLLKPFLNSTGALMLANNFFSKDKTLAKREKQKDKEKRKDLFEILTEIEKGKIKALYLLETDLVGTLLDQSGIKKSISKLDLLIEQNAYRTSLSDTADISISSEPFFMKKGTIVNIEGRVLENGGKSKKGLEIMESVAKKRSYEEVNEEVKKRLGVSQISEYGSLIKRGEREVEMAEPEIKIEEKKEEEGYFLLYKTNPFFWNGIHGENFVEISASAIRKLGLFREDELEIAWGGRKERMGFKISELRENLILSEEKLSILEEMLTKVEIKRAK